MSNPDRLDTRVKLSTLWIVVLLNMLFADIFSIMVELVTKNTLEIPGEVSTVMAIAAIVTNIPILMVYFSRALTHRANRRANIVAGVLTIGYVVGGGDSAPHYLIIASLEVTLLLVIIVSAWRWTSPENLADVSAAPA